jgi:hypothetical protein
VREVRKLRGQSSPTNIDKTTEELYSFLPSFYAHALALIAALPLFSCLSLLIYNGSLELENKCD